MSAVMNNREIMCPHKVQSIWSKSVFEKCTQYSSVEFITIYQAAQKSAHRFKGIQVALNLGPQLSPKYLFLSEKLKFSNF